MKRDMDLIRAIAFEIERSDTGWAPRRFAVDGYTDTQVGYHVLLMIEGGIITGDDVTSLNSPPRGIAGRLTWKGHEFIDAARDDTHWSHAKQLLGKAGGASFPVWMEALTRAAITSIGL